MYRFLSILNKANENGLQRSEFISWFFPAAADLAWRQSVITGALLQGYRKGVPNPATAAARMKVQGIRESNKQSPLQSLSIL